jgi:hypothetical protein
MELLKWLLANTDEDCTTYAMDFAARYGHLAVLEYLHGEGRTCTNTAADWAAMEGHFVLLKWLYDATASRCSDLAMSYVAIRGDLEMLVWLHDHDAHGSDGAATVAVALGHTECIEWLRSVGVVTDCDADALEKVRENLYRSFEVKDPWDY